MSNEGMHCDRAVFWQMLVVDATALGVLHARQGQRAYTEEKLIALLQSKFGVFGYRHAHSGALRAAYGAGYKGIECTRIWETMQRKGGGL